MLYSTQRIMTTHAGSLPRPADLREMVVAKANGQPYDHTALDRRLAAAVAETVRRQVECGLDSVNDGELSKTNFTDYVRWRIAGYVERPSSGARRLNITARDETKFADYFVAHETNALPVPAGLSAIEADHLRRRYTRPDPRLALASALLAWASAAMDVSDGLAKDAARMCSASACGGRVQVAAIPLSAACARALEQQPSLISQVVTGGDDYEILAAVPAGQGGAFRTAAAAAGVPVTEIGSFLEGRGLVLDGADGRPDSAGRR